jgi:proteic killer suppression protein
LIKVLVTPFAKKQLNHCPDHIARKFYYWVDLIGDVGLREARKFKGFHDEPLRGDRRGQRSVRLSKGYRVIYLEIETGRCEVIEVVEVHKHEY